MSNNRSGSFLKALDPAMVLGALVTVVFYAIVLQPSMHGTVLHLYTTEHAVEYVITALFFWGMVDILLKLFALPRQFMALRQDWLPARKGREPVSNAAVLLKSIASRPKWMQESRIGRRLTQALGYVSEKGATDDFREYLNHLADQDSDATHANYMLIRFVAGVTPLLGFLGTVVHFGTALSGISVDQMMNQLSVVVQEMGAAFNTTTIAIGAAMAMSIFLFICERMERGIDRSIDRIVDHELLHRFAAKDPAISPMLSSVQNASEEAIREIGGTLSRQTEVWSDALDILFEKFEQRRKQDADGWSTALELLEQRHEAYDAEREQSLKNVLALIESRQDGHLEQINTTLQKAVGIRNDFAALTETFREIARGEGRLLEMQSTLAENIRLLRQTQQLDEAMHGLTAAIHLLTARHGTSGQRNAA